VLENVMIDIMFELPTLKDVQKCVITPETIDKTSVPVYYKKDGKERKIA
jgi:ATP-dependent Clp protease ATP-binding subunit ClpX